MQGIAQISAGRCLPAMILVPCALLGCAQSVPVSTAAPTSATVGSIGTSSTPPGSPDPTAPGAAPVPGAAPAPPGSPTPNPAGIATLTWVAPALNTDGSALIDLAGYNIYYGTSATLLGRKLVLNGTASTTYVVNGLATGTYYFTVTAFSSQGTESVQSNLVSKTF